jgi:hypothetical protein
MHGVRIKNEACKANKRSVAVLYADGYNRSQLPVLLAPQMLDIYVFASFATTDYVLT